MTDHAAVVARLRRRLAAGDLPGESAFSALSVPGRAGRTVAEARAGGAREGAVLVLIYPNPEAPHVVLTERLATLRDHAGQVSLPGGRIEPGEEAQAAALREAAEEIGIPDGVEILGTLSPLWIPPTNFLVFPIVSVAAARPTFRPSPDEVAALIETPLHGLADPLARGTVVRTGLDGRPRRVPAFHIEGRAVWGATAMILAELLAVLDERATPRPAGVDRPSPRH